MPKNIREEFLHLCHLHPRLASNDVDDEESAMQWETSWGSTESSSGHDATQQPVTRLHWGETSPSLSSGFSNWFLHREGWGSWLFEMVTGEIKLGNARQKQSEPDCLRVSWSLLIGRWSPLITEHNTLPGYTSRTQLGEMFLSSIRISLKKYFLFIVDHRDKPARRIIWLSNKKT